MAERAPNDPRCKDCADNHEPGQSRCASCAKRHRAEEAARTTERRRRKLCLTCATRAVKDKRYCKKHLAYYYSRWLAQV